MISIDLKNVFFFLESGLSSHVSSKANFAAIGAKRLLLSYGSVSFIYDGDSWDKQDCNPWDAFETFKKESQSTIFGYLGYDLKNYVEKLSSSNEDVIGAPDQFWFEPTEQCEWPTDAPMPNVVENYIAKMQTIDLPQQDFCLLSPGVQEDLYIKKVQQIQAAIKEGSFYELNFTRLQTYQNPGLSGWNLYNKMKEVGRVPFGAFLNLGNGIEVCCASPERFLKKEGKLLVSQPIKGTRSRSVDPSMDKANYDDLADSEKDQAENLMIVDLVRNDLNRIAKKGSVSVRDLFTIQAFETVYQMVSTVQAELDAKYTATEVLKSAFPMGSMTGAPKVEVMKWIDKLENYKRGIYSGAIGYIDTNENFDFNVVIRTAILKNGLIYYATGGAITSDSNPQSEWHETVVKSAALEAIFKNK